MSDDGKRRSCETELQIEAWLAEMVAACEDHDESTNGLIISSYFLEIGATSFYFKKRRRQHRPMKKTGKRRIKLWNEPRGSMIGPYKFLFRDDRRPRRYIKVLSV